jgi:excisionase family DNA binding protein
MTTHGHIGAKAGTLDAAPDDHLMRLVRLIARQAAQEAFNLFKEALETSIARAKLMTGPPAQREAAAEDTAGKAPQSLEPGERLLSVAEVATRLGVAEKTVRRKIASGDLPAHRIGKLVRVGERSLTAYVTRARPARGDGR